MPTIGDNVKLAYGTQAEYELATKDTNAIYFTSDTKNVYVGDVQYTSGANIDGGGVGKTVGTDTTHNTNSEIFNTYDGDGANTAIGMGAHAEGYKTQASGTYGHSEGQETSVAIFSTGAHAEGYKTDARAPYTHAEGQETYADGVAGHSEGYKSYTGNSSQYAHAEGNQTKSLGLASHSEGWSTNASGTASHAEGQACEARGVRSHAEGEVTKAIGANSHSEGGSNMSIGDYSHSEGHLSNSYGKASHTEGFGSEAGLQGTTDENLMGTYAHAEGNSAHAYGNYSHAEGYSCTTRGLASHAEGNSCYSFGNYSHTNGHECAATSESQTVIGQYGGSRTADSPDADKIFIIASGSTDGVRITDRNIMTVDYDGNGKFLGTVKGADPVENNDFVTKQYFATHQEGGGSGEIWDEYEITTITENVYLRKTNLSYTDGEISAILMPDTTSIEYTSATNLQIRVRTNTADGRILMLTGNLTKRPKYALTTKVKKIGYGYSTEWTQTQYTSTTAVNNGSVAGSGNSWIDNSDTNLPGVEIFLYDGTNRVMIPLLDGSKAYIRTKLSVNPLYVNSEDEITPMAQDVPTAFGLDDLDDLPIEESSSIEQNINFDDGTGVSLSPEEYETYMSNNT